MERHGFAEAFLPAGFGRNGRLERIASLIDWAPVEALVRRGTMGRPPYRALAMVRALLQQWYGLSDPGLEETLSDRMSFRRFCGLALEEPTPHETTLCRFWLALVEAGLGEALFAEVQRQFDAAGFLVATGVVRHRPARDLSHRIVRCQDQTPKRTNPVPV
ncbi:transposase [Sphingomonas sp. 2R-10]|uniref:transposase n=1 Tax=Sphingomonas sp. 2R-10 TaxID=3045148 RepID=UPI000F7BB15A|nr:transposase [Sphingomonas sp. 2R-10]MDJ0278190.1 transposase [Sphingomonas sp. 2R-10]